jgi:TRAP-type mannitol/chloroaromatic compound transport system permease small subunit
MVKFVKKVKSGIDATNEWVGRIASFLFPILMVLETYEVISRYILGRPTIWISELSSMLFGSAIMLGGGYTLLHGSHANMDLVHGMLSKRGKAILDLITFFFFLAFAGILLVKGWQMAWRSLITLEHDSTIWSPPVYYFKMTLPLGALFLVLQAFSSFLENLIIVIKGEFK